MHSSFSPLQPRKIVALLSLSVQSSIRNSKFKILFLNFSLLGLTKIINNGLEGIAPQWVLVHHGHEAAIDDGHRDGKLLRQSYFQVGQVAGNGGPWADDSVLLQPRDKEERPGPRGGQAGGRLWLGGGGDV